MRNISCFVHEITFLVWCISLLCSESAGNEPDRLALLALKEEMKDPSGTLNSWNDSLHYCNWAGVTCSRRHSLRVMALDLKSQKLEGTLSPYIGNLTFLRKINLTMNTLHGPIPQQLGRLFRLEQLYLDSNSFDGGIPTNLSHCSNLRSINLIANKLSGEIPVELTTLSKLTMLYLSKNELEGSIPSSLGNLSSLMFLSLQDTSLAGSIPDDLCRILSLEHFQVGSNKLSGIVPSCLYNLSRIKNFSVANNQLEGNLALDIGFTLPNLQGLYVGTNKLNGIIPSSLSNASRLEFLALESNKFVGEVPRDLGRLQNFRALSLHSNQLGSKSGDDLGFITSLTNCSKLEYLSVFRNSLNGALPDSIANLSDKTRLLQFGENQLHGSIPRGIENLVNLYELDFSGNFLTGEIPEFIGTRPNIRNLHFQRNQFTGQIPDSFKNCTSLTKLVFSENKLNGRIPPSLGNCQNLFALYLHHNRLNGTIPKQVIGLSSLTLALDLANNDLSGSIPPEVGNLTNLQKLDISMNRLSGHIPDTLGNCLSLESLQMESNFFQGNIPLSMRALKGVKNLDLSHNNLSGQIPEYLATFSRLTYLNLSYNELEGPVPRGAVFANASVISVDGNSKLCGGSVELKLFPCRIIKKGKSHALKVVVPMIVVSLFLALLVLVFLIFVRRRLAKKKPSSPSLFNPQYLRISYAELLKATSNFSVDNLIGSGSYSSVYKGVLDQDNTIIAVKVLNLQQQGASKSFFSECNALRNLRHRNLLKIITSCSSLDFQGNDFKALVFEYMPNGSLEEWLHPKTDEHESSNLNFLQTLNIAIDIASALEYLHHYCQPAIIHCDLKPSNVLLDDDKTAHVADFGLAKIFSATSTNSSQSQDTSLVIKGSIGYVAPEYGMGSEVSVKGDVYSYGILLLEMFTKKRPTDSMFQNGLSLRNFAQLALPEQVTNIVNSMMLLEESHTGNQTDKEGCMQECLVSLMRLGVACSAESPIERKNMEEVVVELLHIRDSYQGVGIQSG